MRLLFTASLLTISMIAGVAAELPGEELTPQRFDAVVRRGNVNRPVAAPPPTVQDGSQSAGLRLGEVMQTWNAPTLGEQMAADETLIPFGKGGIFIPRFTETNDEPDAAVYDDKGKSVGTARIGYTFMVLPGDYTVRLGSGIQQQRIVKRVSVVEGRVTPVVPDWSVLVIDVVDEQGSALKGEYELLRIDEFDPYGRGYGASIELGETVRAWVLKPGIYKILGAGAGYHAMTNFVTVRLLPGELTNFLLIVDEETFHIRGGGTLQVTPSTKIMSNWSIGANVGANVLFNAEFDHGNDLSMNSLTMGLLFDSWLLYRKRPVEWSSRLRLDESVQIVDNDPELLINSPDRLLMSSIFIWRITDKVGPYARAEFSTKFFSTKVRRDKENDIRFVYLGEDGGYIYDVERGADTVRVFTIEPGFSPLIFEIGAGASADIVSRRNLELRARLGLANSYSRYGDRYRVIDANKVSYETSDQERDLRPAVMNSIVLFPEDAVSIFEVGPQMSLGMVSRMGAVASLELELKLFAPIIPESRVTRPDVDFNGTLSWRLNNFINLDYMYRQSLKQPEELTVPVHTSSHGIWVRFHFSSNM